MRFAIVMMVLMLAFVGCGKRVDSTGGTRVSVVTLESCGALTRGLGHGSYVMIRPNLVLTAGHCMRLVSSNLTINGVDCPILEKYIDSVYDVGFALIDGAVPFLKLGAMPELFDEVYLLGAPYELQLEDTVTRGIVSGLERPFLDYEGLIQTDAEGAPGSSGGPLVNAKGEVIGICVAGPLPGGGVTLCLPVSHIKEALDRFDATEVNDKQCDKDWYWRFQKKNVHG